MILLLSACAFGPGQGFGTLAEATLAARLEPGPARDLGGGEVLTDLGYAVTVDRLELGLGEVSLLALSGGGGGSFDPANPPDGYVLCHNDECHAEDGRIVSYAEIEAELAGGAASWSPVVTLPVDAAADLLAGAAYTLDVSEYGLLPAADVGQVEVSVTRLVAEGTVRRHPDDGWSAPFRLDNAEGGALSTGVELPFGRGFDPVVALGVDVVIDGTLFDGVDFAAIPTDPFEEHDADPILGAILSTKPVVTVERTP